MTSENVLSTPSVPPPGTATAGGAKLSGGMGTWKLVSAIMMFNGPLGIMAGVLPIVIALGVGTGTPLLFLILGVAVAIFAVGYVAMAELLPRAGAFYTYVTAGLGRPAGLGASFVAVLSYTTAMAGALIFSALSAERWVKGTLHGPDLPWWVFGLLFVLIAGALAYFRVDVSAWVMGVFVVLEVALVAALEISVLVKGGKSGIEYSSFRPSSLSHGAFAVGLVFAVTCFGGFEATAIYRDEVINPRRTLARATFIVVGTIAVFYAFGSWIIIESVGTHNVVVDLLSSPTGIFYDDMKAYPGEWAYQAATALVITSSFAGLTSYHNVVARYFFNLGADGILPRALGRAHHKHGSPHRASALLSVITVVYIVAVAASHADPNSAYVYLVGITAYAFVILLILAAFGIAVYMWRTPAAGHSLWRRRIAPVLSAAIIAAITVAATAKIDILAGAGAKAAAALAATYGIVALGFALAAALRVTRPAAYLRIGQQE